MKLKKNFINIGFLSLRLGRLTKEELEEYNDIIIYLSENLEGSIEKYDKEGNAVLKSNKALKRSDKSKRGGNCGR